MTGISFSKFVKKVGSLLTIIIPIVALSGCGEGDGPTPILGDPTSTAPGGGLLPPGFCDVINFEDVCPAPLESIVEFEGGPIAAPFDNPKVDANNDSAKVGRMQKFAAASGFTYGGSTMSLNTPFTVVAGSSFTMKVWSQRPVEVLFQTALSGDIIVSHGGTGWEVLTFDFGNLAGSVAAITLIFDVDVLGDAGNDPVNWTFYFDDITLVPPGSSGVPIDPEVSLYDPAGNPDLVIPDDYSEVTGFGSESVINLLYADDDTYNPVLAVSSGTGYGANVAQIGFIGFEPGFVTFYETLDFKVKGMPNFVIFVKLYEDGARLRINLSSSGYAEALEDGWYQVSIPLSRFTGRTSATGIVFESDDTAPTQFTFFLTDIGFSGAVDGGDGGDGGDNGGGDPDPVAVVFDDDYGDGVSFAPFGGSVNDVTVDTAEAYSGTAALKVVVPAADYTGGAMVVNPGRDVSAYDTLTFWAKASAARTLNVAGIGNDGVDTTNATEVTNLALTTTWTKYTITIPNPAALTANTGLFHFAEGSDEGVYTIWFDEIIYASAGGGNGGGGANDPTFVNGDFEEGLTGWTQTRVPDAVGTITADSSGQGGRTGTVARLVTAATATQANDVLISQEGLAAGTVAPGDSIDVSFDLYGSLAGAGGVVFVEVIFLNAAGEDVGGRDFVGPAFPYEPTGTWTTYSDTVIAGTATGGVTGFDVSGGVVLSLKVACGAIDGCGVDASFDNVTFTIN